MWFPINDLQSSDKPALLQGEEFEFEKLPLHEAARRIYSGEYDTDKFIVQQRESAALSFAFSFFLGSIIGGTIGYNQASQQVQENVKKDYGEKTLDNKQVNLFNN